jgi:hypothetical protein
MRPAEPRQRMMNSSSLPTGISGMNIFGFLQRFGSYGGKRPKPSEDGKSVGKTQDPRVSTSRQELPPSRVSSTIPSTPRQPKAEVRTSFPWYSANPDRLTGVSQSPGLAASGPYFMKLGRVAHPCVWDNEKREILLPRTIAEKYGLAPPGGKSQSVIVSANKLPDAAFFKCESLDGFNLRVDPARLEVGDVVHHAASGLEFTVCSRKLGIIDFEVTSPEISQQQREMLQSDGWVVLHTQDRTLVWMGEKSEATKQLERNPFHVGNFWDARIAPDLDTKKVERLNDASSLVEVVEVFVPVGGLAHMVNEYFCPWHSIPVEQLRRIDIRYADLENGYGYLRRGNTAYACKRAQLTDHYVLPRYIAEELGVAIHETPEYSRPSTSAIPAKFFDGGSFRPRAATEELDTNVDPSKLKLGDVVVGDFLTGQKQKLDFSFEGVDRSGGKESLVFKVLERTAGPKNKDDETWQSTVQENGASVLNIGDTMYVTVSAEMAKEKLIWDPLHIPAVWVPSIKEAYFKEFPIEPRMPGKLPDFKPEQT